MRAVTKILRARASEHRCNFCGQFEQKPNFASTFKLNETILHPSDKSVCVRVRNVIIMMSLTMMKRTTDLMRSPVEHTADF